MQPDPLPEGPGPLEAEPTPADESHVSDVDAPNSEDESEKQAKVVLRVPRIFRTLANSFRLSRLYRGRPSCVPDADATFADMLADKAQQPRRHSPSKRTLSEIVYPYLNISSFKLGNWFATERSINKSSRSRMINNVFFGPGPTFNVEDIRSVNFDALDKAISADAGGVVAGNGWHSIMVHIQVPTGQKLTKSRVQAHKRTANILRCERALDADSSDSDTAGGPVDEMETFVRFPVGNFHYRSLCHIIKEVWSGNESREFHHHPFEQYWQPPWDAPPERVYSELYTAQAFLDADRALQNSLPEDGCDLPRVIAPLMI